LAAPLAQTRSFMQVVEAIRVSPPPTPIAEQFQQVVGEPPVLRRVVPGIEEVVRQAVGTGALYSELPVGWATAKPFRWLAEHV
jgi:hypothetical protein